MGVTTNDNTTPAKILDHWAKYKDRIIDRVYEERASQIYMAAEEFKDKLVHITGSSSEALQGYQVEWTEKGDNEITPRVQQHAAWKVDQSFEGRKYTSRSYFAHLARTGSDPYDYPFLDWVIASILKKVIEDQENLVVWTGVYSAPVPGVPNNAIDTADGLLKKIGDSITAGEIIAYVTGPIVLATAVDQIEDFVKGTLDTPTWRAKMMYCHCSQAIVDMYQKNYVDTYGGYIHANEYGDLTIPGTNVTLVPHAGLAGSQRLVMTHPDNLVYGHDGEVSLKLQEDKRKILLMADGEFSIDYALAREVFVNDQA